MQGLQSVGINEQGASMPAVGRPTKYTSELLEKAWGYLDDFNHHDAVFPSHVGLALYLGLNQDTLYDWAKQEDKQEFSEILRRVKDIQHEMLIGNGITGKYNSNITKLVLGKHGYSDKSTLTGKDDPSLIPDQQTDMEICRRAAFVLAKALHQQDDDCDH